MASAFDKTPMTIREHPSFYERMPARDFQEHEAITKAGYARIQLRVRPFEQQLIANADQHAVAIRAQTQELRDLTRSLLDMADRAERGSAPDLDDWAAADAQTRYLLAQLGPADDRTGKLIDDLADPLAALDDLEQRFPALRQKP